MATSRNGYDILQALMGEGGIVSRWKGEQRGILQRRKTGWFGRWREHTERDGAIVWEQVTRKLGGPEMTKGEAQQELAARLAAANGPSAVKQNCATVEQFVTLRFTPDYITTLAPATQAQYKSLLKVHILPAIGRQRMRDVTRGMLQIWVAQKARKVSTQTVRTCVMVLKSMFRHADDLGLWRGELPTDRLKLPKLSRVRESRALTQEQVAAIIEELQEPARLLVMTLFYTGMRVGEVVALDWAQVNMGESPKVVGREVIPPYTIAVRRTVSAGQMKDSPKTASGRRNIPIHASLWVALMAVKKEEGLVFAGRNGKPLDHHNIANRELARVGEKLGLGRIGFHVFRHTLSTLAQAGGMAVGEVRGVLGHSSAATTMIYTHGNSERARAVLETIEVKGKAN